MTDMLPGTPPLAPRSEAATDPHRPRFHFLPPANWMNDPNGLIQWNGTYHMFYQYNPAGAFWGTIHWGHATSADLVHWTDQPVALTPGDPADMDGCWSGCAVDDGGVPTLVYTGVRGAAQRPCLATGDASLRRWTKHSGNPVLEPPPGLDLVAFRDPYVWREDGTWHLIIGAGISGTGGAVLHYTSPDLTDWTYQQPLVVGDLHQTAPVWSGVMWECPQLVRFGARWLLIISAWSRRPLSALAMVGAYHAGQFVPATTHRLDYGDATFYAPQTLTASDGRTLLWGWLQEGRSEAAQRAAGWAGVMSLPRELRPGPDGGVQIAPAAELRMLRRAHARQHDRPLMHQIDVPELRGDSLELLVTIAPGSAQLCGVIVRQTPDRSEQTRIIYDQTQGWVGIDTTRASLDADSVCDVRGGPLELAPDEPLQLHIYLDRSVLEVFANGRVCISARIYPTMPDSLGVGCFATNGTAQLVACDVWRLASIWE